jgi:hypothetical protein
MFRSLFGTDWKKSPAHLLLLTKFLSPRQFEDFTKSNEWKNVLGEEPEKAINRFQKEGFIVIGDLPLQMSYKFGIKHLKSMLKERGLIQSGRKEEMIDRLIQADRNRMQKEVGRLLVFVCTEQGIKMANGYLEAEKEKLVMVEKRTIEALSKHDFLRACKTNANYEAEQVFPRGVGMDWKNYDPSSDLVLLNYIFTRIPKALKHLSNIQFSDIQLEPYRIAASMFVLRWNVGQVENWLVQNINNEKPDYRISMMLHSHAHFLRELEQMKKAGIKVVEISTCNDSMVCPTCKKLASKKYKINEVPELPIEKCTSENGCRCWI